MKNKFTVIDSDVAIEVEQRNGTKHIVWISTVDLPKLTDCTIGVTRRTRRTDFYAVVNFEGEKILLHSYLLSVPRNLKTDHKDSEGLNNRRDNIRIVTTSENGQNIVVPCDSSSGILGISWITTMHKWKCTVQVNGVSNHLGYFWDLEKAKQVVQDFRKQNLPFSKEAV